MTLILPDDVKICYTIKDTRLGCSHFTNLHHAALLNHPAHPGCFSAHNYTQRPPYAVDPSIRGTCCWGRGWGGAAMIHKDRVLAAHVPLKWRQLSDPPPGEAGINYGSVNNA